MYLLQSKRVDLGFIGGAEIDRFGNLNTHWVEENGKRTRLPGSGGAADIATMAKRSIIIMNHERRVSCRRFITSHRRALATAAIGDAPGLSGGGPSRAITSMGVFSFDPESHEMILSSIIPAFPSKISRKKPAGRLRVAPDVCETAAQLRTNSQR